MSPVIPKPMKLILLTPGESRRGWMTLGKGSSLLERDAPVSKNNRCIESSHRHGGVREVGMLRSVIEKSGRSSLEPRKVKRSRQHALQAANTARVCWSVRKSEWLVVAKMPL